MSASNATRHGRRMIIGLTGGAGRLRRQLHDFALRGQLGPAREIERRTFSPRR